MLGYAGSSRGTTSVTDFASADAKGDQIALDNDGLMTFSEAEDLNESTPFVADHFSKRDTLNDLNADNDGKLIQLQNGITNTDINNFSADENPEAYVLAFNENSGHGELWFDNDWGSTNGREQIAEFSSLDDQAEVTGLDESDFTLYTADIA